VGKPKKSKLQSSWLSRSKPFKVCVVAPTRKRLWDIEMLIDWNDHYFTMGEKRCGYVGFYYFKTRELADKMRDKYYDDKDIYVFVQDDRPYLKGGKRGRK